VKPQQSILVNAMPICVIDMGDKKVHIFFDNGDYVVASRNEFKDHPEKYLRPGYVVGIEFIHAVPRREKGFISQSQYYTEPQWAYIYDVATSLGSRFVYLNANETWKWRVSIGTEEKGDLADCKALLAQMQHKKRLPLLRPFSPDDVGVVETWARGVREGELNEMAINLGTVGYSAFPATEKLLEVHDDLIDAIEADAADPNCADQEVAKEVLKYCYQKLVGRKETYVGDDGKKKQRTIKDAKGETVYDVARKGAGAISPSVEIAWMVTHLMDGSLRKGPDGQDLTLGLICRSLLKMREHRGIAKSGTMRAYLYNFNLKAIQRMIAHLDYGYNLNSSAKYKIISRIRGEGDQATEYDIRKDSLRFLGRSTKYLCRLCQRPEFN